MSRLRFTRPGPPSGDELLRTLVSLTDEVLDGIKVHQARVELATALQRLMLPAALPDFPGVRACARYAPARRGLEVGGDWYDAFSTAEGRVGIAIGDVQGHDAEAAAFVGPVRTGLRAVAGGASADPGAVLARVNDLLVSLGAALFVTCSFVRFDPSNGELAVARAGHVPAVWAAADGRSEIVWDEGGLPLGMFAGEEYPVTYRRLVPPAAVALLTDGVVEGPRYPIDRGLEAVARLVGTGFDADPELLATEVIRVAELTGHDDDAAVVVIRYDG
ncbi:serine/threonine protein phosphatase [Streptomyces albus subsp. albus]|nr:serine/threonine protein phosphatase [Streptomyces albus subsp. albus]